VISGVFDALSDKITSLVYLDAFVPENGQSLHNILPLLRLEQIPVDFTRSLRA